MKYTLTFYTTRLLKDWQAGVTMGLLIIIRPGYETDEGLYRHELTHVRQACMFIVAGLIVGAMFLNHFPEYKFLPLLWGALLGLMGNGLAYIFVRRYRAWAEAQAYAVQTQFPDRSGGFLSVDGAAARLALPQYDLALSVEQCRALIEAHL